MDGNETMLQPCRKHLRSNQSLFETLLVVQPSEVEELVHLTRYIGERTVHMDFSICACRPVGLILPVSSSNDSLHSPDARQKGFGEARSANEGLVELKQSFGSEVEWRWHGVAGRGV